MIDIEPVGYALVSPWISPGSYPASSCRVEQHKGASRQSGYLRAVALDRTRQCLDYLLALPGMKGQGWLKGILPSGKEGGEKR